MAETITQSYVKGLFKKRPKSSHKGENGTCLIIGGSDDLVGAPALGAMSALACLRSGVDLCHVLAPEKTGWAINTYAPDLIVHKATGKILSEKHLKTAFELEKKSDSILIGPGMGREKKTLSFANKFASKTRKTIVIDADAIRACSKMRFNGNAIITPHAKEFELFTGKNISGKTLKEKIELVKNAAEKYNCVVLFKNPIDIVSDGKKVFLVKGGNPGMTKGGTGDVLAGLCTGFSALGLKPLDAALAASFVNKKSGICSKKEWAMASLQAIL